MHLLVLLLCLWMLSPVSYAAKLYVNATPNDAKIQLLSRKATFSQGVELASGKYYLSVSKPGYRRYMQPIVLKAEDVTLDIALQPTAFPLAITVTPRDAQIRIFNKSRKFQPNELLSRGRYVVEVTKSGYVAQRQTVEIKDQAVDLTIALQEAAQPTTTTLAATTQATQPVYPLYIYPIPKDATIELLGTTTTFQQGMSLATGSYHIRVSKTGYTSRHEWINVGKGGNKVKIELSKPNSCYFAEAKIENNQETASVLRNVTLKPHGDLLEVSYYEQKLPSSESTHLEFIGVNRGRQIELIGTFEHNSVSEEITAELLIDKDKLTIYFKGETALLNQTQCL